MSETPTPQEVQELVRKLAESFACVTEEDQHPDCGEVIRQAAAALSAYQQEVETLRERVAPLDEGPVCLLADYQAMRDRAEAAEAEVERLTKERDEALSLLAQERYLRRKDVEWWQGIADAHMAGMRHQQERAEQAERAAAAARRAAFAEAAQYIRDLSVAAGRDTPDMQALADLVERLAAQAVPPGATED
jgi:DNA repair ATPase RecN